MTAHSMTLRLDASTHDRLRQITEGRFRSNNAAIIEAINKLWQTLQDQELEAAYAAAVSDNPSYPYESAEERTASRSRRNARQQRNPQ
ncbi:MAG: antitoxin [Mycobacterium sp.]